VRGEVPGYLYPTVPGTPTGNQLLNNHLTSSAINLNLIIFNIKQGLYVLYSWGSRFLPCELFQVDLEPEEKSKTNFVSVY
jgi:hypothetical protein